MDIKINLTTPMHTSPKAAKPEKKTDTKDIIAEKLTNQAVQRKQNREAERQSVIQSIVEQEKNRDREGERIIAKATDGKKLTPKEMKYLAEKYPELYEKYKKAEMEREALKRQLKAARSEVEAAKAYSDSVMIAKKTSEDDGEFRMRSAHLREEYNEYVKTNGYIGRNRPRRRTQRQRRTLVLKL